MRLLTFFFLILALGTKTMAQSDTGRVAALLEEGRRYLKTNMLDQAEEDFQHALKQYQAAGYRKLHPVYDLLARVSELRGDLRRELNYRIDEVKSMEETHDTAACDYHYGKLALCYSDLGMYDLCQIWDDGVPTKPFPANFKSVSKPVPASKSQPHSPTVHLRGYRASMSVSPSR